MLKEAVSCMLRRWLGDADFAKGLHAYFEKHNTVIPSVVTFGMLLDKHQDVSQPSWTLVGTTWLPSSHCQS